MMTMLRLGLAALLIVSFGIAGCGKKGPPKAPPAETEQEDPKKKSG